MGRYRYPFLLILLSTIASSSLFADRTISRAKLGQANEKLGAQAQADKLTRLFDTLEMKEGKLTPDAPAGTIDKDSGNPSQSATTLHTYVRSICLNWVSNPQQCQSWLDPYAPAHGLDESSGDYSPLEGMVASKWKETANVNGGGQYRFWEVRRLGDSTGTNLDGEGKFDLSGVTQWNVNKDFSEKIRGLGRDTAARVMMSTYDKNSKGAVNEMPNRVGISATGLNLTKRLRNHLVSKVGQIRAASAPSDFLLSEEVPDCETYKAVVQVAMRNNPAYEEKLGYQGKLSTGSSGSLQSRYEACVKAQQASVAAVNPQGGGDVESEPIDEALVRLNIAAIDHAGINVAELPKPSHIQLTEDQTKSEFVDFESGGMSIRGVKKESNAATLNSFNNNLESAAQKMANIVLRNPQLKDNGDTIRSFKIEPGTKSAIAINDLTPDMKRELASTSLAGSPLLDGPQPSLPGEDKPSELTITRK